MKELQRNLSPRYTNLLKSQTHLLCTKTWRASKFSHLFNPPCKVLALLPALNICIHPSWYAFTLPRAPATSQFLNLRTVKTILIFKLYSVKFMAKCIYWGGGGCTNTSLYRKLFFFSRDNFSSAQDFKWKREVNSFKQEQ